MKPTTPTGSLPVIELQDGTMMGESAVCKKACAAAAGLLGEGTDFLRSELLVSLMEDLWRESMMPNMPSALNAGKWKEEQTKKCNDFWPKMEEKLKDLEKFMLPSKDRFTTTGVTVGEIDVWHRLHQMANGAYPQAVQGGLKAFYDRMQEVDGVKKFRTGQSKWGQVPNLFVPMPKPK